MGWGLIMEKELKNGQVTTDGQYYYQQVNDKLVLIGKEEFEAIQKKNEARIKAHEEAVKERSKQEWSEGNL